MITCLECKTSIEDNWNGTRKYCSKKCQQGFQYKKRLKEWKDGIWDGNGIKGIEVSAVLRRYLTEKYENKCTRCGWCEINSHTKKVPLQVEHIDGNWKNNSEENLTLLCPNCHSLTSTWGGRNKGKGRPRYRYNVPVVQLEKTPDCDSGNRWFKSTQGHQSDWKCNRTSVPELSANQIDAKHVGVQVLTLPP